MLVRMGHVLIVAKHRTNAFQTRLPGYDLRYRESKTVRLHRTIPTYEMNSIIPNVKKIKSVEIQLLLDKHVQSSW